MSFRLLPTKLTPPAADARQVLRDRVIDGIVQPGSVKLVLVRAPAGFGKSTVMAQARQRLIEGGVATAWVTLDASDNDSSRFLSYLHAAVSELQAGDDGGAVAPDPADVGDLAMALIDRVATLDFPFVLFLDEFEAVEAAGVLALVGQLLQRLPAGGRLVIGSRSQPDLRLARLRAAGQMLEIDAQALRFSMEETRTFFARRRAEGLGLGDLSLLHDKTEGWVAALWLAALALEHNERRHEFITGFSGSHAGLAEYLAEEVLARQSEPVRRFLLRTSILGEVSATLCERLMPELDSQDMLRELASANVFLIPLEGRPGTWRYHSLFASYLRAELRRELPQQLPQLHEAAAQGFLAQGRPVPAIDHLIASGNVDRALQLLHQEAMPLLMQGRLRLLTRWFDALPAAALADAPLLQVAQAWAVGYTRGPQAAMALLEATGLIDSQDPEVRAHVAALQASLLSLTDRWEDAYAAGRHSLQTLARPSPSVYADTALLNVLASTAAVLGLFDESRRMLEQARRSQGQSVSEFHRMYSEAIEGIIDLLEGRLRQAHARFRLAVQTSQAAGPYAARGNAWPGLLHAVSVYEAGDLRQAQHLLQVYLPLAREAWVPDHTVLGHVLLSRIAFSEGEIDQSFQYLSELEYLGHERHLPRFVAAARLERAWLLLRQGHAAAAATELALAGESAVWRDIGARRHLAHDWDDLEIGRARWELLAGDPKLARQQLETLLAQARTQRRARRALKLRLLLALAQSAAGDEDQAQLLLGELLRETCGEGAVRLFVDEGAPAAALLVRAQTRLEGQVDPIFAEYLQRLRAAFGPLVQAAAEPGPVAASGAPPPPLLEALTTKEVRILQLLAEGYSNRALTEKLFVSDSTVRTHLRNINSKLGANNRTQAVALGRRHRLIK